MAPEGERLAKLLKTLCWTCIIESMSYRITSRAVCIWMITNEKLFWAELPCIPPLDMSIVASPVERFRVLIVLSLGGSSQ